MSAAPKACRPSSTCITPWESLFVAEAADPSGNRTLHCWLITQGERVKADSLEMTLRPRRMALSTSRLRSRRVPRATRLVAITEEPAGGSPPADHHPELVSGRWRQEKSKTKRRRDYVPSPLAFLTSASRALLRAPASCQRRFHRRFLHQWRGGSRFLRLRRRGDNRYVCRWWCACVQPVGVVAAKLHPPSSRV